MAKFVVAMEFICGDGSPGGVLEETVKGLRAVKHQCVKNREWLQEKGHREVKCQVMEVGGWAHRDYLAKADGL